MPMKSPVHPGRIVRRDCLEPLGLSVTEGANVLGVTRQTLTKTLTEDPASARLWRTRPWLICAMAAALPACRAESSRSIHHVIRSLANTVATSVPKPSILLRILRVLPIYLFFERETVFSPAGNLFPLTKPLKAVKRRPGACSAEGMVY